jgi:hypothetical protein
MTRIPTPAQNAWAVSDARKHLPDADFNLAAVYSLPRPGEEGELAGSATGRTVCSALIGIGVMLVAAIELGAK